VQTTVQKPGEPRPRSLGVAVVVRLLVRHRPRAVGMHRQGYDLQLTRYDDRGWRATFYGAM
jgi:hypothetical protein